MIIDLKYFEKKIFSQNGEDGILEEMLNRLDINNGWVCEFGACDGIYLSNTYFLVEKGFNAVYIESDNHYYRQLLSTTEKQKNIIPLNKNVTYEGDNTLDKLL